MLVLSLLAYLPDVADRGSNDSAWDAAALVTCVKRRHMSERWFANVKVDGRYVRLDCTNQTAADDWFAEHAAAAILDALDVCPDSVVPVPSSSQVDTADIDHAPRRLASKLAERLGREHHVQVRDLLRMRRAVTPARDHGPRDAPTLYRLMKPLRPRRGPLGACLLVDDVVTGGGHLEAAAGRVLGLGGDPVMAICLADSVREPLGECFRQRRVSLEPYPPG